MKSKFIFLLSILSILCFSFALGCNTTDNECKHEYYWTQSQPATCYEYGKEVGTCIHCQKSITRKKSPTPHNLKWGTYISPSCTSDGVEKGFCLDCDYQTARVVSKIAHNFQWTITKESFSCNEYGEETGTCIDCGDISVRQFLGHILEWSIIKNATCSEYGIEKGSCLICSDVCTRKLPKIEHTYVYNSIIKHATCLSKGYSADVCSLCDYKNNILVIDKEPHDFSNFYCIGCNSIDSTSSVSKDFNTGIKSSDIIKKLEEFNISNTILDQTTFSNLCINAKDNLTVNFSFKQIESSLTFNNVKFQYSSSSLVNNYRTIYTFQIKNNYELYLIYTNQIKQYCGSFLAVNPINYLFVNKNNHLIAVYSNLQILDLGCISTTATELNESPLIYERISNGKEYAVVGVIDCNSSTIEIPATYNDLKVTKICSYAFYNNNNIKVIKLGANIKMIKSWAFWKCSNLEEIYLNDRFYHVDTGVFHETNLKKVYYNGIIDNLNLYRESNNLLFSAIWQPYN